jgi:hypothetical protein
VKRKDCTISMLAANLWGLAALVPITLACWGIYLWVWGPGYAFTQMGFGAGSAFVSLTGLFSGLLILVGGICLHEALHVLGWKLASGKPFSAFKFGIDPKTLSPFAHSTEAMALIPYRIGGALPGIITGLFPYLIGLISGSAAWVFWGYLFLMAACGDWIILWLLRKAPADALVEDHPSRAGCTILLDE